MRPGVSARPGGRGGLAGLIELLLLLLLLFRVATNWQLDGRGQSRGVWPEMIESKVKLTLRAQIGSIGHQQQVLLVHLCEPALAQPALSPKRLWPNCGQRGPAGRAADGTATAAADAAGAAANAFALAAV